MATYDTPECDIVDRWRREKVLGSGGFGTVVLWRNLDTNETIALKQCRWGHDSAMTPKHRQRWTQEVDIMLRLSHPCVIKALPVPTPLDVDKSELPLLAMEYCNGGDLRKVLCRPENCCGLPEKQIRTLIQNIASAVCYLHSLRIIHRDLKPENIVLQEVNGEVRYKLIDLGYAKQLDHGSLCTSFVGTLQYLAPELFHSQKYSSTVDYWSLGLVTHEVITGQRPFLPNHSPAQWIPVVSKKSSEDICVYLNEKGEPVFSKHITKFTHISSHFKSSIEKWLQVMLEWDPKKRGTLNGRSCFDILDEMLNKKFVQVFYVDKCQILACEVIKHTSGYTVKEWLAEETHVPMLDQILISDKGVLLDDIRSIEEQCTYNVDDFQLCLVTPNLKSTVPRIPVYLPPEVQVVLNDRMLPMSYDLQRKAWMLCVFFSQTESRRYKQLLQAYRAYVMYLLMMNLHLHKSAQRMNAEMTKLTAVYDMYRLSLKQDMDMYEKQAKSKGITSDAMFEQWEQNKESVMYIHKLQERVGRVSLTAENANAKVLDIQRSPYARSNSFDALEETTNKIIMLYDRLKRRPKEQRSQKFDSVEMAELLCQHMDQRERLFRDVYSHFRKAVEVWEELDKLRPCIEGMTNDVHKWHKNILQLQEKRQKDVWHLMHALVKQVLSLKKSQSSSSKNDEKTEVSEVRERGLNSTKPYFKNISGTGSCDNNLVQTSMESGDFACASLPHVPAKCNSLGSWSSVESQHTPLSLVFEKYLEDSQRIRCENENLMSEMKSLFCSLSIDANENDTDASHE